MAFAHVASVKAGSGGSNTSTSASIDTTGAKLLVAIASCWNGAVPDGAVTDSKTNTWTSGGTFNFSDTFGRLFYCINPTVGSGHTFTVTAGGLWPGIAVSAFSATAVYIGGISSTGTANSTSIQAGSVTPANNGDLIVAGLSQSGGVVTHSIDSSFSIGAQFTGGESSQMAAIAYLIQGTAAAVNPTWSWTGTLRTSAINYVFTETQPPPDLRFTQGGLEVLLVDTHALFTQVALEVLILEAGLTLSYPTIHFNSSTGSDTAASGAGPGDGTTGGSAVTGTSAAHTNGSASTTITLTNSPDLSDVSVNGDHALWIDATSGRKWTRITGKDNTAKTLTVEDSFNIASGSAVNYAVGGKRLSIDSSNSRNLFTTSIKPNWTVDLEDGTYTLTSFHTMLSGDRTGQVNVISSTSTRATITSSTSNCDLLDMSGGFKFFKHLKFTHTGATRGVALHTRNGAPNWTVVLDCLFDGVRTVTQGDNGTYYINSGMRLINCEVKNCTTYGMWLSAAFLLNCYIHDNASYGIYSSSPIQCMNTVIANNGDHGVYMNAAGGAFVMLNCTIANNTGSGFMSTTSTFTSPIFDLVNCIIYGNGGKGIRMDDSGLYGGMVNEILCAYGSNAGGNFDSTFTQINSMGRITLTADPFTAAGSDDYSLNDTAGGGALLREAAFPGAFPGGTTTGHLSVGGVQPESGGGGGEVSSPF